MSVGKACLAMGNFNSLMAIVAALKGWSLSRLRRSWAGVETSALGVLAHQLDPSSNFASYRATLKAAEWRAEGAASDSPRTLVIPFFSLALKDLLVTHQQGPRLPNGHVNFAVPFLSLLLPALPNSRLWAWQMWRQLAAQIGDMQRWKATLCPFARNAALLHHILTAPVFDDRGPPSSSSQQAHDGPLSRPPTGLLRVRGPRKSRGKGAAQKAQVSLPVFGNDLRSY